jgi:hypothetical protein
MKPTFEEVVVVLQSARLRNVRLYLFLTRLNAQNVKYMTGPLLIRSLLSLTNIRNTA